MDEEVDGNTVIARALKPQVSEFLNRVCRLSININNIIPDSGAVRQKQLITFGVLEAIDRSMALIQKYCSFLYCTVVTMATIEFKTTNNQQIN